MSCRKGRIEDLPAGIVHKDHCGRFRRTNDGHTLTASRMALRTTSERHDTPHACLHCHTGKGRPLVQREREYAGRCALEPECTGLVHTYPSGCTVSMGHHGRGVGTCGRMEALGHTPSRRKSGGGHTASWCGCDRRSTQRRRFAGRAHRDQRDTVMCMRGHKEAAARRPGHRNAVPATRRILAMVSCHRSRGTAGGSHSPRTGNGNSGSSFGAHTCHTQRCATLHTP